jgi:hypothetical protein
MSLTTANKDRNLINSNLLKFADSLISEAKQVGIDLRIFEGYRTNERQDYLFKQKTTSLKGGQSKHNFKPSQAITILQYKNNQPTWGGFPQTTQFKNIVNNLLMINSSIEWGGNWKNPLVYQFEIRTPISNKDIIPPAQQNKIIEVTPIEPTIKPASQINPMPVLKPVSVKMTVDNSTLIIGVILAGAFLYFNKK